ncbi:hypothetical protein [Sinomonas sp. P47F7]|uniref:hypothetical protein n=1 Tax=Sinomonas sp. P47F7 TaxID=3410987 RepID=UPI003BF4E0DA
MIRYEAVPSVVLARTGLAGVAALTVVALAGCGLGPKPTPSLEDLRSDPVTTLQYPASALVSTDGADSNNDFGPNSAFLDRTWATKDQASEVFVFFDSKLTALGWTRSEGAGIGSMSWSDTRAWTLGKRLYEVGIDRPDQIARIVEHYPDVAVTDTVFETLQE